jgi:hypothetical protein
LRGDGATLVVQAFFQKGITHLDCAWRAELARAFRNVMEPPKLFTICYRKSGKLRGQRKLAAILAADVVGYSRFMGRDEET